MQEMSEENREGDQEMTCIRCEEIKHLKALLKYADAWEKENGPRRKKALADADRLLEKRGIKK